MPVGVDTVAPPPRPPEPDPAGADEAVTAEPFGLDDDEGAVVGPDDEVGNVGTGIDGSGTVGNGTDGSGPVGSGTVGKATVGSAAVGTGSGGNVDTGSGGGVSTGSDGSGSDGSATGSAAATGPSIAMIRTRLATTTNTGPARRRLAARRRPLGSCIEVFTRPAGPVSTGSRGCGPFRGGAHPGPGPSR